MFCLHFRYINNDEEDDDDNDDYRLSDTHTREDITCCVTSVASIELDAAKIFKYTEIPLHRYFSPAPSTKKKTKTKIPQTNKKNNKQQPKTNNNKARTKTHVTLSGVPQASESHESFLLYLG